MEREVEREEVLRKTWMYWKKKQEEGVEKKVG